MDRWYSQEPRVDEVVELLETGNAAAYRSDGKYAEKVHSFDTGSRDPDYSVPGVVERNFSNAHNTYQSHYAAGMALSLRLDSMGGMAPALALAEQLGEDSANGYVNPLLYKDTLVNLSEPDSESRAIFISFAEGRIRKEDELQEEYGD